jgi:ribokinase
VRFAVVGHVEWCEFALVEKVPAAGEIAHARDPFALPAGGGAVAAVQIAKLAGECTLITALGDDTTGRRAAEDLEALGVTVAAAWRPEPTRRAFVHLDRDGERAITTVGARLSPVGEDPLPWSELREAEGAYFTAGDAAALGEARAAETLVATTRAGAALVDARVELDALVLSARDEGERYAPGDLDPGPKVVVRTDGAAGGMADMPSGETLSWAAAPVPAARGDVYGAGDSFAGGITFALATGSPLGEALELGARCGAACAGGRGPYASQLELGRGAP